MDGEKKLTIKELITTKNWLEEQLKNKDTTCVDYILAHSIIINELKQRRKR